MIASGKSARIVNGDNGAAPASRQSAFVSVTEAIMGRA